MWWHQDANGWSWLAMMLSMALFWAVVIGAAIWAIRSSGSTRSDPPPRHTARETLDERFARGEIGEEEYRRAREVLAQR